MNRKCFEQGGIFFLSFLQKRVGFFIGVEPKFDRLERGQNSTSSFRSLSFSSLSNQKTQTASQLAPPPAPRRRLNASGAPRSPRPRKVSAADGPVRRSGRLDGKPPRCYSEDPAATNAAASREVRKLKSGGGSRSIRERGTGMVLGERGRRGRESGRTRKRERDGADRTTKKIPEKKPLKNLVTSADEVYTQAHVDSLGTHSTPWELFVDGYDLQSGRRLYDAVRGATCHQCRQKTLGTHTSCDCCGRLSGIFCGDCLFMRYGENVREANAAREAAMARREARARGAAASGSGSSAAAPGEDGSVEDRDDYGWVCPPCRGLCNCSFHRARRGWAPTGSLYRYALAEGYASVAHFLVLTNLGEGGAGVVVPPGLRQARREGEGASAAHGAAPILSRPASAAALGIVPDPPVTTTVARGGKSRSKQQQQQQQKQKQQLKSPPQAPGSPLPSAQRAKPSRRRSLGSSPDDAEARQLTSPTLEPAPVVASLSRSLLPNGKRRTGSFMSQLRLNPEALKRRGGGGGATAKARKRGASAVPKKGERPAASRKAVISVSPRATRVSRRTGRGAEVAAAC